MNEIKIRIIDKDEDLLEKAESFIEDKKDSYQIETFTSSEKALEKLEKTTPDIIISEYDLPEVNGLELLKRLREKEKNIPFIIFTKVQESEVLLRALKLDVNDYILKGRDSEADLENLVNAIEEVEQKYSEKVSENELFQDLLERIPDTIYFKDEDARFIRVSKSKAEELGAEEDEIIGKTDLDFYPKETAEEMYEDDMEVIEEEKPIIGREEKVPSPDEEWWASTTKVPRYDEEGNVIGMLGITRDITEKKKAEQREEFLHTLLRHDLRNKISVVDGYLDLLESSKLSEEQKDFVNRAIKAVKDSSELIEKVRTLREVREEKAEEVSLDQIIESVVMEEKPQAENANIELEYERCECKALAGALLDEVFYNLIENSLQHPSGCNKITISTEEKERTVKVIVEDDGCGIPDDIKDDIFGKGFKQGPDAGSGLGLFLVKRIVESYDGNITIGDSDEGGAKFEISLKKG